MTNRNVVQCMDCKHLLLIDHSVQTTVIKGKEKSVFTKYGPGIVGELL